MPAELKGMSQGAVVGTPPLRLTPTEGYFDVPSDSSQKGSLPHYALPNFSMVLPEYTNSEADVIRSAFNASNYTSIADLPNAVSYGEVISTRHQKMVANRQSPLSGTAIAPNTSTILHGQMRQVPDKTNKAKYFMEFEYMPSPYSLAEELARTERLESKRKMEANGHAADFRPADSRFRMPHEDVAGNFTEYITNPFECAGDQVLRQKWLMESKVLAAPFKPAGRDRGALGEGVTERSTKGDLPSASRCARVEEWSADSRRCTRSAQLLSVL